MIVKEKRTKDDISNKDKIKSINEYSGAIIELLDNISFHQNIDVNNYDEFLEYICLNMSSNSETLKEEMVAMVQEEGMSFMETMEEPPEEEPKEIQAEPTIKTESPQEEPEEEPEPEEDSEEASE